MSNRILHMDNPASEWENASPVGCGKIGAMVFGRTDTESIYVNEETIWSKSVRTELDPSIPDKIKHIRELFLENKNDEAEKWARDNMGPFPRLGSYETAGKFILDLPKIGLVSSYKRDLFLSEGVLKISYVKRKISYNIECFASYDKNVIVYKISTSAPINFSVRFDRGNISRLIHTDSFLTAFGETAYRNSTFCTGVKVCSNGKTSGLKNKISVKDSTETVLYISAACSFNQKNCEEACVSYISYSLEDYEDIKKEHIDDFSSLMGRSDITLADDPKLEDMTVAERLARLKKDETKTDFSLMSLYYDFGKYLLISSSRKGSLPANLQGVWAEKLENPWDSDYHVNINLQMNYWQAETANISECTLPLFDYMNGFLLDAGCKTARVNYGVGGMVVHHISDIFGFAAAGDGLLGLWPMGGAWLAYHMWEHYLYTCDVDFLRGTAYRYIKLASQFFMETMFEDKNGRLLSGPSTSPENRYLFGKDKTEVNLAVSPTMDIEIISGLLKFYIETEKILGIDSDMAQKAQETLSKMPPLRVGKYGQLMEWLEDYEEAEPGHRHISHAFALYPGCAITRNTPELFDAVRVSMERRLANGGGHTGWSRAWLINLFARLKDGQNAYDNVIKLFVRSTKDNLFDTHPPFQIDGNFGGSAGIGEMLLQSHEGFISVLPAVTDKFSGSFTSLKARGNIEVSAEFENGKVKTVTLLSPVSKCVSIELPTFDGDKVSCGGKEIKKEDGLYKTELSAGEPLKITVL
ncbi:MAG: glycoside hydrolase family 95 protein [Clostridiales bacterium]|nr:glycoside hydrolase family 95 protein [Clostridiales bacterium]